MKQNKLKLKLSRHGGGLTAGESCHTQTGVTREDTEDTEPLHRDTNQVWGREGNLLKSLSASNSLIVLCPNWISPELSEIGV